MKDLGESHLERGLRVARIKRHQEARRRALAAGDRVVACSFCTDVVTELDIVAGAGGAFLCQGCALLASRGLRADTRIRCTECPAFIAFSAIVDADTVATVALVAGWSVDGAAYFCPDHQLVLTEYQQLVTDREVDPRYALDHAKYIEMAARHRNPGGSR